MVYGLHFTLDDHLGSAFNKKLNKQTAHNPFKETPSKLTPLPPTKFKTKQI